MSITSEYEMAGMKAISEVVAAALREMQKIAKPGMSSLELDQYGGEILNDFHAHSAPKKAYGFPGYTCISVNHEIAHGVPSRSTIFKEGDLINVDVSAELNGFWSDNGGSFVLGEDIHDFQPLVTASRNILHHALDEIRAGVNISMIGNCIETSAKRYGYRVIKNLAGHGVGRNLHEYPHEILNFCDTTNNDCLCENLVIAVETFISTKSYQAVQMKDGWTLVGNRGGYVAQHEHTVVVTKDYPLILTANNQI